MTTAASAEPAQAFGGPLDGTRLGDGPAEEYEVRMADGSRHVYSRSECVVVGPDGAVRLFRYAGRR